MVSDGRKGISDGSEGVSGGGKDISDGGNEVSDGRKPLSEGRKDVSGRPKEVLDSGKAVSSHEIRHYSVITAFLYATCEHLHRFSVRSQTMSSGLRTPRPGFFITCV